jgi:phage terminase large subunit-like protein
MDEDGLLPAPPHIIGPTWRRYRTGGYYMPARTLAYGVVNWWFQYLRQPNGPHAGEPFMPTDEQFRFLCWWYAVDERGKFVYRNGVLRRLKGWGKDPLAAAMALAELCGPVEFSHFDENDQPVGKTRASAWIQVVAVSQDQTGNTFKLFPAMISPQLKADYGLDPNKTLIYSEAGGLIEAVTSSPFALEGKRPTFVILNETQWWMEANQGHDMANVIAGNVDKSAYGACRSLAICNAHRPGEESVGERDFDAYEAVQAGDAPDVGFLYDALEAPADTPVGELAELIEDPEAYQTALDLLREGLKVARGDAVWLDIDNLVSSILDVRNDVTESRRKFLNQVNAAEDSWIAPREWNSKRVCDTSLKLLPRERITLGFDGSKSSDYTALVACRVDDGALFNIKVWNPERYGGEVPRDQVNDMVEWVFATYDVVAFRADVREFESYVDQWGVKFGRKLKIKATPRHAVGFDMRSNVKAFTLDCERFEDAVLEGEVHHNGDTELGRAVTNAHRRPNNHGVSIGKATKDSSRKIDAAVCAVLAFGARQEFLMSKKNRSKKAVILR